MKQGTMGIKFGMKKHHLINLGIVIAVINIE